MKKYNNDIFIKMKIFKNVMRIMLYLKIMQKYKCNFKKKIFLYNIYIKKDNNNLFRNLLY